MSRTSPTEFTRARVGRVVADATGVAVASPRAHSRLAHGARVTVFAVARWSATVGRFQQRRMLVSRQHRPLRFAWYITVVTVVTVVITVVPDLRVGLFGTGDNGSFGCTVVHGRL